MATLSGQKVNKIAARAVSPNSLKSQPRKRFFDLISAVKPHPIVMSWNVSECSHLFFKLAINFSMVISSNKTKSGTPTSPCKVILMLFYVSAALVYHNSFYYRNSIFGSIISLSLGFHSPVYDWYCYQFDNNIE